MRRNRILYGILIFLSFVFVYFYGGKIPYMLFYVTLVLPVISLLYALIIYVRFKYTQDTDRKTVLKGESVNFLFTVSNEDIFLYPYMKVRLYGADTVFDKEFQTKSFSLLPRKGKKYTFDLECKYRGRYEMGIKTIDIEDFLGIFKLEYKAGDPVFVTVLPQIIHLERFRLKTNFISEAHSILNNRYEDMSTISDIREYRTGDSLKKIHWKLSAKMNEIMVKNYQSTSQTNVTFFLDLKQNLFSTEQNIMIEDKLIEAVVAVLHYCLANWVHVDLVYYTDEIVHIAAKNPTEFDSIYSILSVIGFTSSVEIKDIIDVYMNDNRIKTNLLVFTSNMNDELYEEIYKTRLQGYETGVVYVSPEEATGVKNGQTGNILSNLTEIGVDTYKVSISESIKEVLES